MQHISKPIERVVQRTALLCQDTRMKTLFPADHRVRNPERRFHYAGPEQAGGGIEIDHDALLDAVWKLRTAQQTLRTLASRTRCPKAREALEAAASVNDDTLSDIELLLSQKAEAELWLENIE